MPISIAKSSIEKHLRNLANFDEVEIDLFGGEPYVRPDFITEVCEWTWKQNFQIPMIFFITTNGTLIHGDIQDWLKKNKERICLGLSIDGTPSTHNKNRSNSFNKIDIEFFLKTYSYQPVRMTITSDSIKTLFEDITYLHNLGFKITATLAHGINWNIEENKNQFASELKKLADFYIENPQIPVCSLFEMFLPIVPYKIEQNKWCGCGTHMTAIDIDGKEYPCQSFLPSTMPVYFDWEKIDFSDEKKLSDEKCSSCLIKNICPTCYGINLVRSKSFFKRDENLCELNKILALANSYLKGKQIENKVLNFKNSKELTDTINAIKLIQNEFSIF